MKLHKNKSFLLFASFILFSISWISAYAVTHVTWNSPIPNKQYYGSSFLIDVDIQSSNLYNRVIIVGKDENGSILGEKEGNYSLSPFSEFSQKLKFYPSSTLGLSHDEKHKITLAVKLLDNAGNSEVSNDTVTIYWCRKTSCDVKPNTPPVANISGINSSYTKTISSVQDVQHTVNYSLTGSDAEGLASMSFTLVDADDINYVSQTWNVSGNNQTKTGIISLPATSQSYTAKLTVVDANGASSEKVQAFSTSTKSTGTVPIGKIISIEDIYTHVDSDISSTSDVVEYKLVGLDDKNLKAIDFTVSSVDGDGHQVKHWDVNGTYTEVTGQFNVPGLIKPYITILTLTDIDGQQEHITRNFEVVDGSAVQIYSVGAHEQDNHDLRVSFSIYEKQNSNLEASIFIDDDNISFRYNLPKANTDAGNNTYEYFLHRADVERKLSGNSSTHLLRVEVRDLSNSSRQPDVEQTYFNYTPPPTTSLTPVAGDMSVAGLKAVQLEDGDVYLSFTPRDPMLHTMDAYVYAGNSTTAFHYQSIRPGKLFDTRLSRFTVENHVRTKGVHALRLELVDKSDASRTATATTQFDFSPHGLPVHLTNSLPELVSGISRPYKFTQGASVTFEIVWKDSEGDRIYSVTSRYRKKGTSNWVQTPEKLQYVSHTNPPKFSTTFNFTGSAGEYELQSMAWDGATSRHTEWKTVNTFVVSPPASGIENRRPKLKVKQAPAAYVEPGKPVELRLYGEDEDKNLQKIAVNWNDGDTPVDEQNAPNYRTLTFKHTYHTKGTYTITARAYDALGTRSQQITWSVFVGKPPVTGIAGNTKYIGGQNYGANTPTNISSQANQCVNNPDSIGKADPVDTASGAQELTYTLMQVKGIQPLALTLSYNSLLLADSLAGKGWNLKFLSTFLQEDEVGNIIVHWSPNSYNTFLRQADGSYASVEIACQFDTLVKNMEGSYTLTRKNQQIYQFNVAGDLVTLRDNKNRSLEFTYDTERRLTQVTEPHSGVYLIYEYNAAGLLSAVSDPLNRRTRLDYDAQKHLIAITNPVGDTTQYTYNEFGQIVSATNNEGQTLFTNTFDEYGRVVAQDDALNNNQSIHFSYDETSVPGKLITTVTNRDGSQTRYTYNANYQVETVKDALGHETKIAYDDKGRRLSSTDANGKTTYYGYDELGNLMSVTGPNGNVMSYITYDANHNVLSTTDANDHVTQFEYDANNNRVKSIDAAGNVTRYTYNEHQQLTRIFHPNQVVDYFFYEKGRLNKVVDALGRSRFMHYDAAGRLIKTVAKDGAMTEINYDGMDRVIAQIDPLGHVTQMTYSTRDQVSTVKDAKSSVAQNAYNSEGWLISNTNVAGKETRYEYDDEGRIIATTDSLGQTTRMTYNARGEVVKITSPSGKTIQKVYDAAGHLIKTLNHAGTVIERVEYDDNYRPVRVYDAEGHVIQREYDANGNVIAVTDQLGHTVRMEYDKLNRVVKVIDARGAETRREYDISGNLVKEINPLGQVTEYKYNRLNQLAQTVDAKGNNTDYYYDTVGRLIAVADTLRNTTRLTYDQAGQLLQRTDALGHLVEKLHYDALGQVVEQTDALGNLTKLEYDVLGNVVKITDPLQRVTQLQYDEVGRLYASIDALQGHSHQNFDADGQRTDFTDPNNNVMRFSFDELGRVIAEISVWGGSKQYTYNARDLVKSMTNLRGQASQFEYDAAGRLVRMTDKVGEIGYRYDENGNVIEVTTSEGTLSYEYDALNRIVKYTDLLGDSIGYTYDETSNLAILSYPDGKQVHYDYDVVNRLVKVTDWAGRETHYEYDANGRMVKHQRPNGTYQTRVYDKAGQLVKQQEFYPDGTVLGQYDYHYDVAGNIVEEVISPEPTVFPFNPIEMTYGAGNRLASFAEKTVMFDADGNMLHGPVFDDIGDYEFDARNRLVRAGQTAYRYDAENKRIAVIVDNQETRYLVNPQPALSQILRRQANGSTTWYVYGAQGLIGEETNGVYRAYHFDYRGSTVALTDEQGALVESFQYSPFAVLVSQHPSVVDTPFLYNGRDGVMTDDNGLYYMRARFYSPLARRFVNQDVLLGSVDDAQSLNRYAYVTGQPVSFVDPFGLASSISSSSINTNDVGSSLTAIKYWAEHISNQAFKSGIFKKNKSDGFGGLIKTGNKIPYKLLNKVTKIAGNAANLLTYGLEANSSGNNISNVLDSNASGLEKAGKISGEMSSLVIRGTAKIGTGLLWTCNFLTKGTKWVNSVYYLDKEAFNSDREYVDAWIDGLNSDIDKVTGENIWDWNESHELFPADKIAPPNHDVIYDGTTILDWMPPARWLG